MHYIKRTKIVATIGPASRDKKILEQLVEAGANVFRLNFSHGTHDDHQQVIDMVRAINKTTGTNVALLQDLQGPKIRIGLVKDGQVEIRHGDRLHISITKEDEGDAHEVGTTYKDIVNDVAKGDTILIDDGNINLQAEEIHPDHLVCQVIHGGFLKSRKGINLPSTRISAPCLTEKDLKDLAFGLEQDVDWIALSFVRKASDIQELKDKIAAAGRKCKVIAKIEKPEALENIDEIIDLTDAVMVARGDLGVEIPMEDVPVVQKELVLKCNKLGKPVIIATQMMESMIENPRPTRAETNDVANAVMDGADALMLSAESAAGNYPVETVRAMTKTISSVELAAESIFHKYYDRGEDSTTRLNDLLIRSAVRLGESVEAAAIVGMTKSGYTGLRLALHRPKSRIFVFTNDRKLLSQMALVWGVRAIFYDKTESIDDTQAHLEKELVEDGHLQNGDVLIQAASMPLHWKGHTNMVKVSVVGE